MDWNLKDLYSSIESKEIKSDFIKLEKKSLKFSKKYRNKISENSSAKTVLESIVELEKIYEGLEKYHLILPCFLLLTLIMKNTQSFIKIPRKKFLI